MRAFLAKLILLPNLCPPQYCGNFNYLHPDYWIDFFPLILDFLIIDITGAMRITKKREIPHPIRSHSHQSLSRTSSSTSDANANESYSKSDDDDNDADEGGVLNWKEIEDAINVNLAIGTLEPPVYQINENR